MAGRRGSLCFVILEALSHAADPESIAVIGELLQDPEEVTSGWAAIALFTIGNEADDLRAPIGKIRFPQRAVAGARGRGVEPPKWLPAGAIQD